MNNLILEILNDKMPSDVSDDPSILFALGDFIKYEGIVYQRKKLYKKLGWNRRKVRKIKGNPFWKQIIEFEILFEKWPYSEQDRKSA